MKVSKKLAWLFLIAFVLVAGAGCNKVINEVNRSIAPDYFKTPGGVDGAVIGAGAVITRSISAGERVAGVPGRTIGDRTAISLS